MEPTAARLPLDSSSLRPRSLGLRVGALIVLAATFVVYVATAARGPVFGDGLELAAAAACNGVPHPTGYPTLMVWLASAARGEHAYFFVTVRCALLVAMASMLVTLVAGFWQMPFDGAARDGHRPWHSGLAVACGLLFGFSAGAWGHATCVETYSMQLFLIAWVLALAGPARALPMPLWHGTHLSVVFGLACTNHVTALSLGPLVAWRVLGPPPTWTWSRSVMGAMASLFGFFVGLLPYVLLPLRAAAAPAVNWGDARTLDGFIWLIRGGDYGSQRLLQSSPGVPFDLAGYAQFAAGRALALLSDLGAQWIGGATALESPATFAFACVLGVALVVVMGVGARAIASTGRIEVAVLLAAPVLQVAFFLLYNILDIADYFPALWLCLAPFLVVGMRVLLEQLSQRLGYLGNPHLERRLVALLAALVVVALLANWKSADRSRSVVAQRWIDRTLAALPPNAILITHGDYDIYAMWYAQQCLGQRPDVLVIGANFLRSGWYASMIPSAQPDALGRQVRVVPGGFKQFTLEDHVANLRDNVIGPHLGRVPVCTTDGDAMVLNAFWSLDTLRPIAALASPEEVANDPHHAPGSVPMTLYQFVPPAPIIPSAKPQSP